MTVRRAINILADQDMVNAEQGRGTFVKPVALSAAKFQLTELENLFSDHEHTFVDLLETRIVIEDECVSRKLGIEVGQRTIFIRRLVRTHGVPAFCHREYLIYDPRQPLIESEMEVTSLQRLFSGTGETILMGGLLSIEATLLNKDEAGLLNSPPSMAAFCIEHLFSISMIVQSVGAGLSVAPIICGLPLRLG